MSFLFGSRRREEPPREVQPAPEPARPAPRTSMEEATQLERTLTDVVRRVNRSGGRMPEGGIPAVHEVEDQLRPLLRYLRSQPVIEAEMIPVRALVSDYLPTTVDRFIALPPDFAMRHKGRHGLTPAQDLLTQLRLLGEAARECAEAIYSGDAQELANQGRFLHTKFTRSDLDLG